MPVVHVQSKKTDLAMKDEVSELSFLSLSEEIGVLFYVRNFHDLQHSFNLYFVENLQLIL